MLALVAPSQDDRVDRRERDPHEDRFIRGAHPRLGLLEPQVRKRAVVIDVERHPRSDPGTRRPVPFTPDIERVARREQNPRDPEAARHPARGGGVPEIRHGLLDRHPPRRELDTLDRAQLRGSGPEPPDHPRRSGRPIEDAPRVTIRSGRAGERGGGVGRGRAVGEDQFARAVPIFEVRAPRVEQQRDPPERAMTQAQRVDRASGC